jgi:hypothetical protein
MRLPAAVGPPVIRLSPSDSVPAAATSLSSRGRPGPDPGASEGRVRREPLSDGTETRIKGFQRRALLSERNFGDEMASRTYAGHGGSHLRASVATTLGRRSQALVSHGGFLVIAHVIQALRQESAL